MATALQPDLDSSEELGAGTKTYPAGGGASPLAPPSYLSKYAGQIEGVTAKDQAAADEYQSKAGPRVAKLENALDAPLPTPPDQQKIKPPPDPATYQKDAKEFASAMAVLGAVAGRFTRRAGNASLNAFSAAIKGFQTGNLQAYEQATKQWQEATEQTISNNKLVLDKYKEVLENRKLNIDDQMASIQLLASEYHDKMTFDAAAAKNYTLVAQIYEKNQMYTDKVQAAKDKLDAKHGEQTQKNEANAKWLASPQGQAFIAQLPPEEQLKYKGFIEQYGTGTPRSAPAMALKQFIQERVNATGHPPSSAEITQFAATFTGDVAALRAAGGRAGQIEVSAKEAAGTFRLAREASDNLPRGTFVPITRLVQMGQQATSNPAYRRFMAANESAVTAYGATMSRNGVNTVAAQERAHSVLDTADSQQAYNAGLDQLQQEVDVVEQAPAQARDSLIKGFFGAGGAPSPASGPPGGSQPAASGTTSSGVQWSVHP